MKVFVYFNLHKKLWSIRALEGNLKNRVIAHKADLLLVDCTFKVSEAGRKRVLNTCTKNVHAGVVGTWVDNYAGALPETPITYNPYISGTFRIKETNENIFCAAVVKFKDRCVTATITNPL